MQVVRALFVATLLASGIAACGGGGSASSQSNSNNPPPPPVQGLTTPKTVSVVTAN